MGSSLLSCASVTTLGTYSSGPARMRDVEQNHVTRVFQLRLV